MTTLSSKRVVGAVLGILIILLLVSMRVVTFGSRDTNELDLTVPAVKTSPIYLIDASDR